MVPARESDAVAALVRLGAPRGHVLACGDAERGLARATAAQNRGSDARLPADTRARRPRQLSDAEAVRPYYLGQTGGRAARLVKALVVTWHSILIAETSCD